MPRSIPRLIIKTTFLLAAIFATACSPTEPPTTAPAPKSPAVASPAAPQPTPSHMKSTLTPASWAAYQTLASAEHFSTGLVGEGADVPAAIPAFQLLVKEPAAKEVFHELAKSSNGVARAYALCGIYQVDRRSFHDFATAARRETPKVPTMSGCKGYSEKMSNIIGNPDLPRRKNELAIYDGSTTKVLLDFTDPRTKLPPTPIPVAN